MGQRKFKKINRLSVKDHFKQFISPMPFKYFNNTSPAYMNDVFKATG